MKTISMLYEATYSSKFLEDNHSRKNVSEKNLVASKFLLYANAVKIWLSYLLLCQI